MAGPIEEDQAKLTNSDWMLSAADLRAEFDLSDVLIVNDFAGTAMGMPHLSAADRYLVGPIPVAATGPIGVIGPGTGLGMSALVPNGAGWTLVPGEGGHATMAAATHRESQILDYLRVRWEHLSAERVLSGAGLVNLYEAVCALDGSDALPLTPAEVTQDAMSGSDQDCVEAFETFCAMLGTIAGNLALTLGATGGIYITGGIVSRFKEAFAASQFRTRFKEKGRLKSYLKAIPTYLVLHEAPALLGLANLPLRSAGYARYPDV